MSAAILKARRRAAGGGVSPAAVCSGEIWKRIRKTASRRRKWQREISKRRKACLARLRKKIIGEEINEAPCELSPKKPKTSGENISVSSKKRRRSWREEKEKSMTEGGQLAFDNEVTFREKERRRGNLRMEKSWGRLLAEKAFHALGSMWEKLLSHLISINVQKSHLKAEKCQWEEKIWPCGSLERKKMAWKRRGNEKLNHYFNAIPYIK